MSERRVQLPAHLLVAVGLSVANGLIGRERKDVLDALDRDRALDDRISAYVAQHWIKNAMTGSEGTDAAAFQELLDDVIAMKDAS